MSGTSLDGIDAVDRRFRCGERSLRDARRGALSMPEALRATLLRAANAWGRRARAFRAGRRRACRPVRGCDPGAARSAAVSTARDRCGRRARPDGAPSARRAVDDPAQQSGARRRATRHDRRRRLPASRHRRGRAGRTACARLSCGDVRARGSAARRAQPRRHRQPHAARARSRSRAASTPGRETCCSMHGTRGIATAPSTRAARGPRPVASCDSLLDAMLREPYFALRRRRRARDATCSTSRWLEANVARGAGTHAAE